MNYEWILKRLVAPGIDGANNRKALSQGEAVTVNLYGRNVTLHAVLLNGLVCLQRDSETLTSTPFVPWNELDDEYAERLSKDTLFDDALFLDAYFARFPD